MYRYSLSLSFLILRDYRLVTKEERKSQANSPLVIIKYARINAKVARPAFFPNERVSDFSRFQKFLYRHIGCFEAETRLFRSPIADNARALVGNVVRAFENEVSCVVCFFFFFFSKNVLRFETKRLPGPFTSHVIILQFMLEYWEKRIFVDLLTLTETLAGEFNYFCKICIRPNYFYLLCYFDRYNRRNYASLFIL